MGSTRSNAFTFVHAADLHLDSPFKGITADSPVIAETLRSATFNAYNSLIDLCIEHQVSFLLISGDIYDGEDRSLRAQLRFRDGLVKLDENGIKAFIAHGNHDPHNTLSPKIQWPKNTHIFAPNKVESIIVYSDGGAIAMVSGISHGRKNETQNLATKFKRNNSGLFEVGLLHCNVGSHTGHDPYAPCELSDLLSAGLDYWALGHVHEKKRLNTDPYVVYPGNSQGRHFHECGERGCFLVKVQEQVVSNIEFIPLDGVRWLESSVSIDGLRTLDELDRTITQTVNSFVEEAAGRAVIARMDVIGRGPLYIELRKTANSEGLLERVRELYTDEDPFVWIQEITISCRPEIDIERRRETGDFLGQALKIAKETVDSSEKRTVMAQGALSELTENRHFQKAIGQFSAHEIEKMIEEASFICIDSLETGE